jgi:hypothetical protein
MTNPLSLRNIPSNLQNEGFYKNWFLIDDSDGGVFWLFLLQLIVVEIFLGGIYFGCKKSKVRYWQIFKSIVIPYQTLEIIILKSYLSRCFLQYIGKTTNR